MEKFKQSNLKFKVSEKSPEPECDSQTTSTIPKNNLQSVKTTKKEETPKVEPTPQKKPNQPKKKKSTKNKIAYPSGLSTSGNQTEENKISNKNESQNSENEEWENAESTSTIEKTIQNKRNKWKNKGSKKWGKNGGEWIREINWDKPQKKKRKNRKKKKKNNENGWKPGHMKLKTFSNEIDISSSFVHISEYSKQNSPDTKSLLKIEDHSSQFEKVRKNYSMNRNFDFIRLDTKYFTSSTFVKLQNYNLFLAADSPAHPDYKPGKHSICVYRQIFDASKDSLSFESLLDYQVDKAVQQMLVNEDEDLVVVVFENCEMQLFYLEHRVISVGGNTFFPQIRFDPIEAKCLLGQQFSANSVTMVNMNPHKIRLKDPSKSSYFAKCDVRFSLNNEEYLTIFNKTNKSLEFYNINNLDNISCCMRYTLRNLPEVTTIIPLENNWIALGCSVGDKSNESKNLVVMNLKNMDYSLKGWEQLVGVQEMVFDQDNGLLFVASILGCFSVLKFEASCGDLNVLGTFKVGPESENLSLRILRSRQNSDPNRLVVLESSDHMFTYSIRENGNGLVTSDDLLIPIEMAELSISTFQMIDLHLKNKFLLVERKNGKKLDEACIVKMNE